MKIKYDLQVFHNIVLFKVLEMDEKYRNRGNKISKLFNSTNKIDICSESCVGLYDEAVYIIGKHFEEEDTTDLIRFSTIKEAQSYADKVRFALEEWNNHVEIMEIECKIGYYGYVNYSVQITGYNDFISVVIEDNDCNPLKEYFVSNDKREGFTLDKTIIMFNRDCELLNIPFRLKGDN